jgi:hypothetical protein
MQFWSVTIKNQSMISRFEGGKKVSEETIWTETTTHDLPFASAQMALKQFGPERVTIFPSPMDFDQKPGRRADVVVDGKKSSGRFNKKAPIRIENNTSKEKVKDKKIVGDIYGEALNKMVEAENSF